MTDSKSDPLHRLIYYSYFADSFPETNTGQDAEIGKIVEVSIRHNGRDHLTGLLLAHQASFLQVLEGPLGPLMACFERIKSDSRHRNVKLVGVVAAPQRQFPDWTMCARRLGPTDDAIIATLNLKGRFVPDQLTMTTALNLLLAVKAIQTRANPPTLI